jgi:membrane-bound serine protease (ClpP class)
LHLLRTMWRHGPLRVGALLAVALAFVLALASAGRSAGAREEARGVVLVAPVHGTVDLGLTPFLERVLDEAEREHATAVVLDIDTFGGRVDAAVAIRDRLLASPVRTIAFVHPRAISAGALVSLATSTIAMSQGATIGAATPVQMQPGAAARRRADRCRRRPSPRRAPPGALAAQLSRGTPCARTRPSSRRRAWPRGKLLTLTGEEAIALGFADLRADDLPSLMRALDLGHAELRQRSPNWAERAVSTITAPIVSSILMTLGMLGLLVEIRAPGFGVPGIIGIVCLALFFGGQWIAHLAGFEELLLIGVGIAALAVEIFVIPGFGVAGIIGIVALTAGLGLSLVGSGASVAAVVLSLGRVALSFIVAVVAMLTLGALLPHVPLARRIVLTAASPHTTTAGSWLAPSHAWLGVVGSAVTPLHPAGTARLDGERVDVIAEGEFVPAGAAVEVIKQEGNRVVVRPVGSSRGAHEGHGAGKDGAS